MDNESVNKNDIFQMQQLVIFLKAEVAKYKNEVAKHQENDYYSLVEKLDEENSLLLTTNKELLLEIAELKEEMAKLNHHHLEKMQEQESHNIKQMASIEALLNDQEALRALNEKLSESLKEAQQEMKTGNEGATELKEFVGNDTMKNLEQKLFEFTEVTSKQMTNIAENVERTHKEIRVLKTKESDLVNLLKVKNEKIEKLLKVVSNIKQQNEIPLERDSSFQTGKYEKNTHLITYLDAQMKKMLEQSIDFEEQVEAKIRTLNELEQKINELTDEVEGL